LAIEFSGVVSNRKINLQQPSIADLA
jgi:hypothetical protein